MYLLGYIGMLKLCFRACSFVRQVYNAGGFAWAFSNAPWPREIIGMTGCILEVSFFNFDMKQDFAHVAEFESSVSSCKPEKICRGYIFPGASI